MSEHELWNELGNLYFLSGAQEQAIHAYTRSIALDKKYGRAYCNMALAYVHTGKCHEAIRLYERGVNLLSDDREKSLTWSKLGDVYRHLKDYRKAVEAYEWADVLDPSVRRGLGQAHKADALLNRRTSIDDVLALSEETAEETPPASSLTSSLPPLLEELTPWSFDDQIAPPEDEPIHPLFDMWFTEETGVVTFNEGIISTEPLRWKQESFVEEALDAASVTEESLAFDIEQTEAVLETETQLKLADVAVDIEENPAVIADVQAMPVDMFFELDESPVVEDEMPFEENQFPAQEDASLPMLEDEVIEEEITSVTPSLDIVAEDVTDFEAVQYEQVDEMLPVQLTPEERYSLEMEIFRCTRVLEINPGNPAAWDRLGGLYKVSGRFDEAVEAYQKAISLDRKKAAYHYHLGLLFAAQRRLVEAIPSFEKVIELEPEHGLAHAALSGYYRRMGQEELAQDHIEIAMNLMDDEENEYNLACWEAICGNTDRAIELLEFALKNKQTAVAWVQRDPDLDFIRSDPRYRVLLSEYAMPVAA